MSEPVGRYSIGNLLGRILFLLFFFFFADFFYFAQVAEQTQGSKDVEVAVIPPHPFLVPAKEQVC